MSVITEGKAIPELNHAADAARLLQSQGMPSDHVVLVMLAGDDVAAIGAPLATAMDIIRETIIEPGASGVVEDLSTLFAERDPGDVIIVAFMSTQTTVATLAPRFAENPS